MFASWSNVSEAGLVVSAAHCLVLTTLLLIAGLAMARLARRSSAAAESTALRTTLAASVIAPVLWCSAGLAGLPSWRIAIPSRPIEVGATALSDQPLAA